MQFYKDYMLPLYEDIKLTQTKGPIGFSHETLSTYHLRKAGTLLNEDTLRKQIVPQLKASGLVDHRQPDFGDRRSKWIYPKWSVEN